MARNVYVFAGGGTGGHLFPGLAVAEAVRELDRHAEVAFFTTNRPLDGRLLRDSGYERVVQEVRPLTANPLKLPGFWRAWRRSVGTGLRYLRERRAQVQAVLGLGGYAAGPMVVAGRALGVRTAILNPDALPGRANRFLAKHSDLVVMQWEASRPLLEGRGARLETWGCPIRRGFRKADAAAGRGAFGLEDERPVLLVTGASQGARTVNAAMRTCWPDFAGAHPEWQLLHLTGAADCEPIRAAYAEAGVAAQVVDFTDDMHLALAAADVVVSRAGASTLAELTALGKPGILLPYPYHRDKHQTANGQVLADAAAALLLEDTKDAATTAPLLRAGLELFVEPVAREKMGAAARKLGKPDAAEKVAGWMCAGL